MEFTHYTQLLQGQRFHYVQLVIDADEYDESDLASVVYWCGSTFSAEWEYTLRRCETYKVVQEEEIENMDETEWVLTIFTASDADYASFKLMFSCVEGVPYA